MIHLKVTFPEVLLIRQDIKVVPAVFATEEMFMSFNENDESAGMFSRYQDLEDYRQDDGKLYFAMCYPRFYGNLHFDSPTPCYEWTQNENPTTMTTSSMAATGLQVFRVRFLSNFLDFLGLVAHWPAGPVLKKTSKPVCFFISVRHKLNFP